MTVAADSKRLYKAVYALCLKADTDTSETVDWLCGPHGGMAKLFASYFAPDILVKSFGEKYPRNPDAKCKCERGNTQPDDLLDLQASIKSKQQRIDELESQMQGLSNEINDFQNTIEKQRHVMNRAMEAWDSTTHQKNGDGRLWQCMEELRHEMRNVQS